MMIYLFPFPNVISQMKAYIFSASMENPTARFHCISKTQNCANKKQQQHNQLKALHFLFGQNKLSQMKIPPYPQIFTPDGLFMSVHLRWCLSSYRCVSVFYLNSAQKKKQVKMTNRDLNCSTVIYRKTMLMYDLKAAYHKNGHDPIKIKLRFISHHIFKSAQKCPNNICPPVFLILGKPSFSYCLWLYRLYLETNDKRKDNATTNSKRKKVWTIPNKRLVKCSSYMLSIHICQCRLVCKKIKTVNICIYLKMCLEFIENIRNKSYTLYIYTVKFVYYNDLIKFNKVFFYKYCLACPLFQLHILLHDLGL